MRTPNGVLLSTPFFLPFCATIGADSKAVPRKQPLPKREAEVCERVKNLRLTLNLSRIAFAKELHEDSSAISSIEHKRAPLRFRLGAKIVRRFVINPAWLARGDSPLAAFFQVPKIPKSERRLFPDVFDQHLANLKDRPWPSNSRDEIGARLYLEAIAQAEVRRVLQGVPTDKLAEFMDKLRRFLDRLNVRYDVEPAEVTVKREQELAKRRLL